MQCKTGGKIKKPQDTGPPYLDTLGEDHRHAVEELVALLAEVGVLALERIDLAKRAVNVLQCHRQGGLGLALGARRGRFAGGVGLHGGCRARHRVGGVGAKGGPAVGLGVFLVLANRTDRRGRVTAAAAAALGAAPAVGVDDFHSGGHW